MGSISAASLPLQYPPARRDDSVTNDFHGTLVADPYRWLEDPEAEETKEFVGSQVELTDVVMESCKEERERILKEVTKKFDHARFETPVKKGGKYFYLHNSGLQAQNVLFVQQDLEGEPEVLLDPNALSEDGSIAVTVFTPSEDGQLVAYGISESGSDWVTIKVISVGDKRTLADNVSWVKFSSISWTHDNDGFFYSRYPPPPMNDLNSSDVDPGTETDVNLNQEVFYHFVGTAQSEDVLCWRDPQHPKYHFTATVTDDGQYVLLDVEEGCDPVNKLYCCDLSLLHGGLSSWKAAVRTSSDSAMLPFVKAIDNFEAKYTAVANDGTEFTFLTNKQAPRYRLIRVDLRAPDGPWTEVIPEHEMDVLESAVAVGGDRLVACYLSDVKHVLQVRDLRTGTLLQRLPLEVGAVTGVSGHRNDHEFFVGFTGFLTPGIIYRCHVSSAVEMSVFREVSVQGLDPMDFEVKQVFAPSGTVKIPMFIVSRKGIALDGTHPALLYGYGGFNISVTPSFDVSHLVLVKNLGFVYCVANIRGGGEYGEEWHKAGSLGNKQNCFDDFAACAKFLVAAGYTVPSRLCIEGESNGGLLVAASVNQHPELYGCVLAGVGVMDMLRFHKFTIGYAWTSEYGCSENEKEFGWLIKYSPLHNVRRPWERPAAGSLQQYPAMMLLTADHDDRVVPLHTLKLLATLQYELCKSQGSGLGEGQQTNPIIGRIDRKTGHGSGKPTQKTIEEAADRYGFAAKVMGASWIN